MKEYVVQLLHSLIHLLSSTHYPLRSHDIDNVSRPHHKSNLGNTKISHCSFKHMNYTALSQIMAGI